MICEYLKDWTPQQVFDKVAKHLLSQNQKCGTREMCHYRHKTLSCAAGCLIPDHEYKKDFEGLMWRNLVGGEIVPEKHCELIANLQAIHDTCHPESWKERLMHLATKAHLSPAVLEEA